MFGRVRVYNSGFAVFTLASVLLSFDPFYGGRGALWLIGWLLLQAIGGARPPRPLRAGPPRPGPPHPRRRPRGRNPGPPPGAPVFLPVGARGAPRPLLRAVGLGCRA